MDENKSEKCVNPKVKNVWQRKTTFFEVAATQSSVGSVNPYLPNALVDPIISVLDPCSLHSSIHTLVDWNTVEMRLRKLANLNKQSRRIQPSGHLVEVSAADFEGTSDGGTSQNSSPVYSGRNGENRNPEEGEAMDIDISEEIHMRKEKDTFIDEIVNLIRNIRKHNDPSLASSPTWIDRLHVNKISKQIILIQSYLPTVLSFEEIVSSLLFENGPLVMENLLCEIPENLTTIVNILTNNHTPGTKTRYRNLVIGKVVELYPYFARRIIERFAEKRSDCIFACRLAVDHLTDRQFLEFVEPVLTQKDTLIHKIVVRCSNRQVLPLVVNRLLNMAEAVLTSSPDTSTRSEMGFAPYCTQLSYCLVELMNTATEPWKEQDVIIVTKFVFRTDTKPTSSVIPSLDPEPSIYETMDINYQEDFPSSQDSIVPDSDPEASLAIRRSSQIASGFTVEPTPFGDAHECFVLSALIAVPFFTQYPLNQTGAVQPPDRAVDNWLEISRRRVLVGEQITSTFGAHLIYVHSCIMSARIDELAVFASDLMKQKVEFVQRQNHSLVLKNAFTSRCMTEMEVAKRSMCLEVKKCSSGNAPLSLRAIHALQTAGVYKTFQINIGEWLEQQLNNISLPASKLLADVVDGYAQSSSHSKGKGLNEEFIQQTFSGDIFDMNSVPKRIFVLMYLCAYREAAQRHDASLRCSLYDFSIFRIIPVRFLISAMEQQHDMYENVRFQIIARVAVIFPYSLPTPESLSIVDEVRNTAVPEGYDNEETRIADKKWRDYLREHKDSKAVLERISRSLRNQLAALPVFVEIFMDSLNSTVTQGFEQLLVATFNRYENLDPFPCFIQCSAAWIRHDEEINVEDIAKIPSLLFRCDRRILSSPPHFYCFVRTLNFFNKMVRTENRLKTLEIQHKALVSALTHKQTIYCLEVDRKEKELLTAAYLDTQHSILIHALVEVCDSKRMKDDLSDFALLERRRRIRRIAFDYIHRTFLDYEGLIRVVLHQRFPLRQVRDLVEGIPALFAGNTQVLEMLSLADQQRRFFAIVFAAELCRKYRVRESLETARAVCDIVHSLHKFGELPSTYKIWKHVAPALMILATEFPSLGDSIDRLLIRVSTNARNRLAIRCGFLAGDPRHEEYRLIETISSFLDRNRTLEKL